MGLIFLDAYEPQAMGTIIYLLNVDGMTCRLYKNNYTPVDGSVLANFTEADFSGYAPAAQSYILIGEVGGKALMQDNAVRTFSHNGGPTSNVVYGYYVLGATTGLVAWAERFAAPISMAAIPDTIKIQTQLTLDSENH